MSERQETVREALDSYGLILRVISAGKMPKGQVVSAALEERNLALAEVEEYEAKLRAVTADRDKEKMRADEAELHITRVREER